MQLSTQKQPRGVNEQRAAKEQWGPKALMYSLASSFQNDPASPPDTALEIPKLVVGPEVPGEESRGPSKQAQKAG